MNISRRLVFIATLMILTLFSSCSANNKLIGQKEFTHDELAAIITLYYSEGMLMDYDENLDSWSINTNYRRGDWVYFDAKIIRTGIIDKKKYRPYLPIEFEIKKAFRYAPDGSFGAAKSFDYNCELAKGIDDFGVIYYSIATPISIKPDIVSEKKMKSFLFFAKTPEGRRVLTQGF